MTYMTCDAMLGGVAAYVSQKVVGEKNERIVAVYSKSLTAAQRNYPATKREGLGLVFGLLKGKCYLWGREFVVRTDHQALTYLLTCRELNDMMREWLFVLLDFTFTISYLPGVENVVADFFSRWLPDFLEKEKADQLKRLQQEVAGHLRLLPAVSHDNAVQAHGGVGGGSDALVQTEGSQTEVQTAGSGTRVVRTLKVVEDAMPGEGVAFHVWAQAVMGKKDPAPDRLSLLEQLHKEGHMGGAGLAKRLWDEGYWWQTAKRDAEAVVASCMPCLRFNVAKRGFHPARGLRAVGPWDHICIDVGSLSLSSAGFCKILVAVDVATGFIVLRAMRDETADTIAFVLLSMFCDFGFPRAMQSDNGPSLVADVMVSLARIFDISKRTVSAYNPQANGPAENGVKLGKKLIKQLCGGRLKVWERYVCVAQFGLNCRISSTHNSMPFSLFYVRPALLEQTGGGGADGVQTAGLDSTQIGGQVDDSVDGEAVEQAKVWGQPEFLSRAARFLDGVLPVVAAGRAKRRDQADAELDKSRRLIAELKPGTIVLMRNEDKGADEAPWSPPMIVVGRHGNSYQLRWGGSGTLLERLVPVHRLKIAPKGTSVDGVYEIEQIIDHRPADAGPETRDIEYLIKWVGFDRADSTWEPSESLQSGGIDAISDYWDARLPQQQSSKHRSGRQIKKDRRIDKIHANLVQH